MIWLLVGIYEAWCGCMLWMKFLLLFGALFDVCMALEPLDQDQSLAIWYKFDSANPELNSGFIGSPANFPTSFPTVSAAFTTTENKIRGDASHPMLNYVAASNFWTQPSTQSLTFSFWFFIPSAENLLKAQSLVLFELYTVRCTIEVGWMSITYDGIPSETWFDIRLLDDHWTLFTVNLNPGYPGTLFFYVNGVLQYTSTQDLLAPANGALFSPTQQWNLNIGLAGTDVWKKSLMDDFRLYTRKLTDSEIMSLYTLVNMPCVSGYTGTTGNCMPCISGTYKDFHGSATCTACQGNTTSWAASTSPSACTCKPGYTGTGTLCSECVVGKYKRILGSSVCAYCGFGQKAFYPGTVECVDPEDCVPGYAHEIQYVTGYSIACAACPAGKRGLGGTTEKCKDCGSPNSPDYYSSPVGASVCSPCPSGFVTTYSSVIQNYACTCDWGYANGTAYVPASPCIGCSAGKYRGSPDYRVDGCSDCPQGKYSTTIAATSSSSCASCPAGKYSLVSGATSSSGCVNCPNNAYGGGASCTCNQGYRFAGLTGGPQECVGCPAGKFNNDFSTYCASCPAGTTSPIGTSSAAACTAIVCAAASSLSINDCKCNAGYTGADNGVCLACAVGKYKTSSGSVACTVCETYSNSPSGSSASGACTCNAGYTGADGGPCSACVAGKYKTSSGNAACTDCAVGTYSGTVGATAACTACGAGGTSPAGSTAFAACTFQCSAGSTGPPGACVLCVAGKYKTSAGSAACTDCGTTTYSVTVGASASSTCLACPSNANAPVSSSASAACTCNAGFTGPNGGVCSGCVAGKYKDVTGSGVCSSCPGGTYSTTVGATVSSVCIVCPVNSTSAASSSAIAGCSCNAGSSGPNGGVCTACVAGKYKTSSGSVACTDCGAGTYSAVIGASTSATCSACPGNTSSPSASVSIGNCVCNAGFTGPDGGVCQLCAPNTYKTTTGDSNCTNCPVNTMTLGVFNINLDACVCNAGYSPKQFANLARSCGVGENLQCGLTSTAAVPTSQLITWGSLGGGLNALTDGIEDIKYPAMLYPDSPAWFKIDFEKTRSMIGISVLLMACANSGTCQDSDNWYFAIGDGTSWNSIGNMLCKSMVSNGGPYNSITSKIWITVTCDQKSMGRYMYIYRYARNPSFAEVVPFGYGECASCSAGKYKTIPGASTCLNCPANSDWNQSSCICNMGYTGPDGGVCSVCQPGSFKAQTGSAACELCPNNTFSVDIGRNSSCVPCQANAVSASGSASQASCYCRIGYAHAAGVSTCRICDPGTYNSQLGRTACSNCSVGLYSVNYGAIGSETCVSCPLGQWSPEGSPNCNLCPANSRAAAGSGLRTDCICDAGYTGADGSTCVPCAIGTYKDATGSAQCSACPALMSTSGVALRLSDCWCVSGYIQTAGACVAMAPRAVVVEGSLAGVSANSSASDVANATQAVRERIAALASVPVELVRIERVENATGGVRVSIFGRTEAESRLIERIMTLATSAEVVSELPFTLRTGAYTDASVLAAPRGVVVACSLLNLTAAGTRRLLQSGDVVVDALAVLRLEMSERFNVSFAAVRLSFDALSVDNTLPLTVTIDVWSAEELQAVTSAASLLKQQGSLVLANAMVLLILNTQKAGPSGLNFTSTLERADGERMTLAEMQAGTVLATLQAQLSVYYGVPASAVEVTVVVNNGVHSVQTVVRAVAPETVPSLQSKFAQSTPTLYVSAVPVELAFRMTNVAVSFVSSPEEAGVQIPNAVSIQTDLVDADGAALMGAEVAEVLEELVWQMSRFFGVDVSLVLAEGTPGVRVVIRAGAAAADDVFQRAEQLLTAATALVRERTGIPGLRSAVTTVLQGQTVAGQFVECAVNYRVYNGTCQCALGHMLLSDLSTCAACAAGSFGNSTSATTCAVCPANTFSTGASTACSACHANAVSAVGSASADACSCVPGYSPSVALGKRVCLPCAVGSYKSAVGNVNCTACWTGSSVSVGGSTEQACCPADSTFSTTCVTEIGPNLARSCGTSGNEACVASSRSQWQGYGAQFANDGVTGTPFISNCCGQREEWWQVDLSRQRTINTVVIYREGSRPETLTNFKLQLSNDGINFEDCATGQESAAAEPFDSTHTCEGFAQFLRVSMVPPGGDENQYLFLVEVEVYSGMPPGTCSSGCLCNPRYTGPADGPCAACRVGKYKNTTSIDACAECTAGSFSDVNGSTGCALCPANTYSGAGAERCSACPNLTQSAGGSNASSACECVAGYTGAGGMHPCTSCAAGTYKTVAGSGACTPCPTRTFSGAVGSSTSQTCTACHPNATSAAGSPSKGYCYCEAGFAQVNGTAWCALCNPGKYNTQLARTACSNCTVGLYAAGYGAKGLDSCFPCLSSQWSPEGSPDCKMCPVNSAAPARSGSIANCRCNPGFTGPNEGPCAACAAATYKPANGSAACTSCPQNANSLVGSTNVIDCSCNTGYTGPNVGPCVACAAGTAKNTSGTATCGVCPVNTYAASAALTCTSCPAGFLALPGMTTVQDCCALNSRPQNITTCNSLLSITACARFITLTPKPSFASISTRNNAGVGTIPTYNAVGGPNGKGHVSFNRANSQYLDAGSRTFNIATNGGFTIVAVVRFTGSSGAHERILDMGSGPDNNNLFLAREATTPNLLVDMRNGQGGDGVAHTVSTGAITQNLWLTVVVSYLTSTRICSLTVNGVLSSTTGSITLTDRTVSLSWMGRSHWADSFLNADLAGVFVVDEFLNADTTTAISNAMKQGIDLTNTPCEGIAQYCSSTLGCSCNTGYTGPETGASKGQCSICPAGTYKSTNGSAACTNCTANANSLLGSKNVGDCSCNPGYSGSDVGPCVACAAGTVKNMSGSAACSTCPADTFTDSYAVACTQCPAGFKALPGTTTSTDCCGLNSSPRNITICPIINQDPLGSILVTSPAYLMTSAEAWDAANTRFTDLSGNGRHGVLTAGAVTIGSDTGNGAGLSIPRVQGTDQTSIYWGAGSIPSTFTVCSITRYSGAFKQRILQCNNMNWLHGHFGGKAGATHYNGQGATESYSISPNTNWVVVCGRNIAGTVASVIANGVVTCTGCRGVGDCNLCININGQSSDWQLSRLYVWDRHLTDTEFAEASVKLNNYVAGERPRSCVPSIGCSCNTGYTGPETDASKGQCSICPAGTYKPTNGTAACTSCTANANSSLGSKNVSDCSCNPGYTGPDVGPCPACAAGKFKNASGSAGCDVCPANSYSVSARTNVRDCSCNPGYTGPDGGECLACVPGKYKRVLGTSACITCPANTEAPGAATIVCSSVAGFSGIGYALEDVARSCGSTLTETCKTLSNGATTNAVGAVDGALDANTNTFVSVAFNPNLARSCGITGAAACLASNGPVGQGAANLAVDGDINTASATEYGRAFSPYFTPYWSVDFGRIRSVFAVKILNMIAYGSDGWTYLKDFKITVGDSPEWSAADGTTPLNAVCADYLSGTGRSYVTVTCEDTVRGRYLHVVGGPHLFNYVMLSEVVVEAFNYTANPALMQPWWAVDFAVERAVAGVVIQTQAATTVQVRVGASTDPMQNAVCGSITMLAGVNNTITCASGMVGRYLSVIGAGNSVLVLNEVRVAGIAAAQCAAGSYKPAVGNTNCTACPAFSTSAVGATLVTQCSCSAPYF